MQTNSKLREAMEAIEEIYNYAAKSMYKMMTEGVQICDWPQWLIAKTSAVLALPRLNCEIGTAEEQAQRFREWCKKHDCPNCQFAKSPSAGNCALGWAQMPYEEKEGGEEWTKQARTSKPYASPYRASTTCAG